MSQLERAVEVMDRLRSPGGCPWDAEQTHASLARYLLEETYEVLEAIETGDDALLREELGDLLLQVLFHARIAEEHPEPYSIEDVARDLVDKLVRRHPHVFAGAERSDAETLNEAWEWQKIAEKGRTSAVDGVPPAQPALALAAKLTARARRAGLEVAPPPAASDDEEIGHRLFAVVQDAVAAGVDPEGALRRTTRAYREAIRAAESSRPTP
jgi:XTP/dITP diphosphohydrolase